MRAAANKVRQRHIASSAIAYDAFGLDTWRASIASAPAAKAVLDDKMLGVEKLQSVFGAVRLLGGGADLAYILQFVTSAAALATLVVFVRQPVTTLAKGAAMATAAALTSPYFLDYDLALVAIPLAWAASQGMRTGFMPWEKSVLAFVFALPAFSRVLAGLAHLPLAPVALVLLYWCVVRRATMEARRDFPQPFEISTAHASGELA